MNLPNIIAVALALHFLASVIWIGGMFFAYIALRPSAAQVLEPPLRLQLWVQVLRRFFIWVWAAVIILPVTGYWMVWKNWGGFANTSMDITIMHIISWIMFFIYTYVFFVPYRRLSQAVAEQDYPNAGKELAQIRFLVATNLTLGLLITVVASAGRYL